MMDRIPISVDKPTVGIRIAQVIGLTASAYVAGAIGGISFMSCPAFLEAPAPVLVKQWKKMFDTGKVVSPPLALLSAAIFAGLAYRAPAGSNSVSLYSAAAVLVPTIIPYTIVIMKPTNDKLIEKASSSLATASLEDAAAESGVAKEETVHSLVDKWATLNFGRSMLPLLGTILAAWAAVDKYEVLGLASVTLKSGANRMG